MDKSSKSLSDIILGQEIVKDISSWFRRLEYRKVMPIVLTGVVTLIIISALIFTNYNSSLAIPSGFKDYSTQAKIISATKTKIEAEVLVPEKSFFGDTRVAQRQKTILLDRESLVVEVDSKRNTRNSIFASSLRPGTAVTIYFSPPEALNKKEFLVKRVEFNNN